MNNNADFKIQHDGTWYTLEELSAVLEPVYRSNETFIRNCITGLTQYGACLAAEHQDAQIPELRQLITDMAEFWNLDRDESKDGYLRLREKYGGAFDWAVAQARDSRQAPGLSAEAQGSVLYGLELHAKEMTASGGLERWVQQCDKLTEQLHEKWREPSPQMGGMSLG